MAIEALALLHLPSVDTQGRARVDKLDDAVIVHTGASFASEPDELGVALMALVDEQVLIQHDDPRGILFIPSVAAPQARSYAAVVAEVGEGGVWARFEDDDIDGDLQGGDMGDFGALLGNVFAQMPPSLLSAASAAAQGDRGALDSVAAQVQAMLGSSPALQGLAGQLSGMMGQGAPGGAPGNAPATHPDLASLENMFASFGGGEAASAAFRDLAGSMQAELAKDPEKLKELAATLLQEDASDKPKK